MLTVAGKVGSILSESFAMMVFVGL
jgi:hypothetical protein